MEQLRFASETTFETATGTGAFLSYSEPPVIGYLQLGFKQWICRHNPLIPYQTQKPSKRLLYSVSMTTRAKASNSERSSTIRKKNIVVFIRTHQFSEFIFAGFLTSGHSGSRIRTLSLRGMSSCSRPDTTCLTIFVGHYYQICQVSWVP